MFGWTRERASFLGTPNARPFGNGQVEISLEHYSFNSSPIVPIQNSLLAVKCPFSLCIWIMIVYIMYIYSKKPKPNVGRSAHGYMQPQIMQWFSTSGPGTTSGP